MKTIYVKRTQKDYSLSLKLQIVQLIKQGNLSTTGVQRVWYSGKEYYCKLA
ncbi:hypothetical protein [Lutibacter sp.]|uniref:hypothetical protein n=1 Tax=Lutibacter sp. TaxID=1925666 RepID=UPI0025C4021A|nr:hypothetical protein [Lutibacter sp.]MCF6181044.1 hypothetical protein [Lutibacter sp.]